MADLLSILMGEGPDAAEAAQAMAEQMRRQRAGATLGAMISREPGAALSGVSEKNALQDQSLLEKAAQARMYRGEEAKNRDFLHKMELEKTRLAGALARTLAQAAGAKEAAEIKANAKSAKPLPEPTKKVLRITSQDLDNVNRLRDSFNPEFSKKFAPNAQMWVGRNVLQPLGAEPPEAAATRVWWQHFWDLVEIPKRHERFGSALSGHEKAIFEQAKDISPTDDPKLIQDAFDQMTEILSTKLMKEAESAKKDYNPESVAPFEASLKKKEAAAGGPVQEFDWIKGKGPVPRGK